jgi:hypothetical protein
MQWHESDCNLHGSKLLPNDKHHSDYTNQYTLSVPGLKHSASHSHVSTASNNLPGLERGVSSGSLSVCSNSQSRPTRLDTSVGGRGSTTLADDWCQTSSQFITAPTANCYKSANM